MERIPRTIKTDRLIPPLPQSRLTTNTVPVAYGCVCTLIFSTPVHEDYRHDYLGPTMRLSIT